MCMCVHYIQLMLLSKTTSVSPHIDPHWEKLRDQATNTSVNKQTVVFIHCKFVHLFCRCNMYCFSVVLGEIPALLLFHRFPPFWHSGLRHCVSKVVWLYVPFLWTLYSIKTFLHIRHEYLWHKDKQVRFCQPKVKHQSQTHYFNSSRINMMIE